MMMWCIAHITCWERQLSRLRSMAIGIQWEQIARLKRISKMCLPTPQCHISRLPQPPAAMKRNSRTTTTTHGRWFFKQFQNFIQLTWLSIIDTSNDTNNESPDSQTVTTKINRPQSILLLFPHPNDGNTKCVVGNATHHCLSLQSNAIAFLPMQHPLYLSRKKFTW